MALLGASKFPDVFTEEGGRLCRRYDDELLCIEPWGENSLRVRATKTGALSDRDWALLPSAPCSAKSASQRIRPPYKTAISAPP